VWSLIDHYDSMTAAGLALPPLDRRGSTHSAMLIAEWPAGVAKYLACQPENYRGLVERITETLPPMEARCRVSVLVPARNEAANLPRLLDLLDDQRDVDGRTLTRSAFEVVVLINRLQDESDDGSRDAIARWSQSRSRRYEPRVIEYVHPPDELAPLTLARKLLADVAVLRSAQRVPARPVYLASEDADLLWIDPCQLDVMVRTLDSHPILDAVRGQQDRCPWLMCRFPLLFLMRRSWNFAEAKAASPSFWPRRNPASNFNWNRIVTSGWNTAVRAEAYLSVGGYTRDRRFEEDMDLGEKISVWRGQYDQGRFIPYVEAVGRIPTRSEGSPRRWLYQLATGLYPYSPDNGYANFFAPEHEHAVKKLTVDELAAEAGADRLDPETVGPLLSRDYQFLLECTPSRAEGERAYASVLAALGFRQSDFSLGRDHVVVKTLDGPVARIRSYASAWSTVEVAAQYPPVLPTRRRRTWRLSVLGGSGSVERVASPTRYPVVVVGCGRVVESGHVPAYRSGRDRVDVRAVVDPSPQRRNAVGAQLDVPLDCRYSALGDLCRMAFPDTPVAVVATPTGTHRQVVAALLELGLPVLCEKPLAVRLADGEALAALAARKGVGLAVIHNYRFAPRFVALAEIAASGEIGCVHGIEILATESGPLAGLDPAGPNWREDTARHGTCMHDQGYHYIDWAESILGGRVTRVAPAPMTSAPSGLAMAARLMLDNGTVATIVMDWTRPVRHATVVRLIGDKETVEFDDDTGELAFTDSAGGRRRQSALAVDLNDDGFRTCLPDYIAALSESRRLPTSVEQALHVLAVIELCVEAGFTGRQLSLASGHQRQLAGRNTHFSQQSAEGLQS
jgi:predicted dehydrogenase